MLTNWTLARHILDIAKLWYRYLGHLPHHVGCWWYQYQHQISSLLLAEIDQVCGATSGEYYVKPGKE